MSLVGEETFLFPKNHRPNYPIYQEGGYGNKNVSENHSQVGGYGNRNVSAPNANKRGGATNRASSVLIVIAWRDGIYLTTTLVLLTT